MSKVKSAFKGKVTLGVEARRVTPETAEGVARWVKRVTGVHVNVTNNDEGGKTVTFIDNGCWMIVPCGAWLALIDGELWHWWTDEEFETHAKEAK